MVGKTISHYEILERLGGGGMGVVYKARDLKLDRLVALKFLPSELAAEDDPNRRLQRERFTQEAKAASALDHSNIGTIHEIDETEDGQIFIVMAFYEGETLKKKIEKGPLPVTDALEIGVQIAQGLAKAHEKGIVHRDIKPANVMVTSAGETKIIDFGLAKLRDVTRITTPGTVVGTVAYMSPEQVRVQDVDERVDVWALGVVLFEMLTGRLPFPGDQPGAIMQSILTESPASLRSLREDVPPELERVISKSLEKEPAARYGDASEVLQELRSLYSGSQMAVEEPAERAGFRSWMRRPAVAIPFIAILFLLCVALGWLGYLGSKRSWARSYALPEIQRLADEDDFVGAVALANEAEHYISGDPALEELWPLISQVVSVRTTPPGADVYMREYKDVDAEWEHLGQSPMENIRVPVGLKHWKVMKEGFVTEHRAVPFYPSPELELPLNEEGSVPTGMVRVPESDAFPWLAGINPLDRVHLDDYWIDSHEVTNRQFKRFLDSGGYQEKKYWIHDFIHSGRVLDWEEAVSEFLDATGRPGPATWQLGDYPQGQDDYPVTGVSWYEVAAYAEFVDKSLPTIFHWTHASGTFFTGSDITSLSNFESDGTAPVGSHRGMGPYGTYDMAGNVREWCWNASGNERFLLGGSWNDPTYMFGHVQVRSPFDRSTSNGFRLVRYLDPEAVPEKAFGPVEISVRDYYAEKPVSDEVFEIYKEQFSYDPTELNASIEWVDDSHKYWTAEMITFDAAYGDERMIAFLLKPKSISPPYQAVILFPGSSAINYASLEDQIRQGVGLQYADFMVKGGRALIFPVYKGTYERNDGLESTWPNMTHRYTEYLIRWVKDFRRTIDYLETRDDVASDRLAYFGISWGGRLGAIIPAVEERLDASILYSGGLAGGRARPEVDQINYVTRVRAPVLMLNGRHDSIEPVETAQIPLFELLGTPEKDKRHVIYETGHLMPINSIIKETLDWLDRYLGPVQ